MLPLLALRPAERLPALQQLLSSSLVTNPYWAVALVEREANLLAFSRSKSTSSSRSAVHRGSGRDEAGGGWHGWEDADGGSSGGSGGGSAEEDEDDESFVDAREEASQSFDGGADEDGAPLNVPPGAVWGDAAALADAIIAATVGSGSSGEQGGGSSGSSSPHYVERLLDASSSALDGQSRNQRPPPGPARRARMARLQADLASLQGADRAAQLLAKHGQLVSLAQLRAAGLDESKELIRQLLARAERQGAGWTDAKWAALWRDVRAAQQAGLPALPDAELATLFLRTVLLAGRHRVAAAFLPSRHEAVAAAVAAAAAQAAAEGRDAGAAAAVALEAAGIDLDSDEAAALLAAAANAVGAAAAAVADDEGAAAGARSPRLGQQQPDGAKVPPRSPRQALLAAFSRQPRGIGGTVAAAAARQAAAVASAALQRAAGKAVGHATAAQLAGAVHNLGAATKLGAEAAANLVGRSAGAAAQLAGTAATLAAGAASSAASTAANIAMLAATTAGGEGGAAALLLGSLGAGLDVPGARGLLSDAECERVVVEVAREALYSASDMGDGNVDQAVACLELLPGSKVARRELDGIAALRRLPEFGVSMLPAQLRDLPDRRQLLRTVMTGRGGRVSSAGDGSAAAAPAAGGSSGVAPWRRLSDVLEVAALLGLDGRDTEMEVGLYIMI